ncbi:hypothetical protein [Rubellicoccus peritrichatus]|uniref:Glycosyltransferase RgtA/B/C/D-like domain-containing protein n=1 Tax=Rubellicoccus peritrichatus TaxID=3080537 RepID=A0AAQ3L891_9BACT|nr:hypothetical protein [Puniceicoccus sp. CR14]WOO39744.1 hypothetical protein RZN69_14060 [Puniceicoccus sp. CR14]
MQRIIHWLEEGQGRRFVIAAGVCIGIVFFSLYLSYKRYRGPDAEAIFEQALVAKSLAEGAGFSTPVRYPQAVAVLEANEVWSFEQDALSPELYQAPLYSIVLAGGLKVLPESLTAWLWEAPDFFAYHADFYLLAINLLLFWTSCGLLWVLAFRLFNRRTAWVSLAAYFFSVSVWEGVLGVSGLPLLSTLILALILVLQSLETLRLKGISAHLKWFAVLSLSAGLISGLLFLSDYTAALLLIPALIYFVIKLHGTQRWIAPLLLLVGFLIVSMPWMARNIALTGSPVGLAWQEIGLRSGDPTASPREIRTRLDNEAPAVSLRKAVNKGLNGIKETLREGVWSGGALLFAGFFFASFFYRFKITSTNNVRWLATGVIAMLLLGQPFLDDGEGLRLPAAYLTPLIILFGAGFFLILLESTAQRTQLERLGLIVILLLVQALPLSHLVLEPSRGAYYAYPPYSPRLMHLMKAGLKDKFFPNFGLMADVPAGVAWYSQEPVWAQPEQYRDMDGILAYQPIGALYLSPEVLDRPFFGELLQEGGKRSWDDPRRNFSWGAVYATLPSGQVPSFFPLQKSLRIWDNTFVLMDVRALAPVLNESAEN